MDFEQELNRMIDIMTAQSGRSLNSIVMHPNTAQAMVSNTSDLAEGGMVGDGSIRCSMEYTFLVTMRGGYRAHI